MRQVTIRNLTRDTVVAARAGLADYRWASLRGLIGRRQLEAWEGLLISPCSSIHTFFMAFPIEALFVDKEGYVLRVAGPIAPWRIGPIVRGARYVIELPVGAGSASHTERGDQVIWSPA